MNVAIIDADLLGRTKHRFPNLVCEKLSAYWKEMAADVELKLNYEDLDKYDEVFISKVFTDTWVPEWISAGVNMDTCEVIAERLVNAGLSIIDEEAKDVDEEAILFACLRKLDKKYEEIFEQ